VASDFLPYLKFYPAETLADERFAGWDMAERGTWFTLILHAWNNGSIPSDEGALARIARMKPAAFRKVWAAISDRFIPHPEQPGRLTSRRLEQEREEARAKSAAGRKGAESRWRKGAPEMQPLDPTTPVAMRSHSDGDAEAMPAAQHSAAQRSTTHPIASLRAARMGVGHPAFDVVTHWTGAVWPALSGAACPDVTAAQAQSLAVLSGKHGAAAICAAMDAAAADEYWGPKLDLDTFVAKHAKWLARKAGAPPPPPQRPPGANPVWGDPDFDDPTAYADYNAFEARSAPADAVPITGPSIRSVRP
jgi:uncharacterized protein YdaU (DUF1376 family)